MPPLFVVLLIGGFIFANRCPYAYGQTELTTFRQSDAQIAQQRVNETFGRVNTLAVIVPKGDYEQEGRLLRELDRMPETDTVLGLANVEAMDGYHLTDALNSREFSELAGVEYEAANLLYTAYAVMTTSTGRS